jgi:hypothetical protein
VTWLPASLGGRLLLALLLAAVAIAALIVALPATPLRIAAAEPTAGDPEPLSLPALPAQSLPVWLCAAARSVPPTAAPVLEINSDGSVVMRRQQPVSLPALTAAPAVILPAASLRGLSARQRGSLCECLAALLRARPLAVTDVQSLGVQASSEEWRALLAWVR